jgi:DNA polymerase
MDLMNFDEITERLRNKSIEEIAEICSTCPKCDLAKTRTKVVFGEGVFSSKIMLIGEGPGQQEDETGRPFVGRAGKLLNQILESEGISREKNIYICNVVKCRPPGNRVPTGIEIAACREYLLSQILLMKPKIIILCGSTAVKSILKTKEGITKIRGKWFDGPFGSKIMPFFHPSYLLRNQSQKEGSPRWLTLQDIKEIKRVNDSL